MVAGDDVFDDSSHCGLKDTAVALIVNGGQHVGWQHHDAAGVNEVGEVCCAGDDLRQLSVCENATQLRSEQASIS